VQLPPIGYQPGSYPAPPSAGVQPPMDGYNGNHMYSGYGQPASPYAPPNQQMYNQREDCHNGPSVVMHLLTIKTDNGGQPSH
jgi:hypothetical protein